MDKAIKQLGIITAIFSLISVVYSIYTNQNVNDLKLKQEQRDSVSFKRDFKFKIFDYVTKSLEKGNLNRNATIILIQNMVVDDEMFKAGLVKTISANITDTIEKKEVFKTLDAIILEKLAFRFLLDKKFEKAKENFSASFNFFPTLHNVDEINKLLKSKNVNNIDWKSLYKEIYPKYQWGMSKEIKNEFIIKTN